MGLSHSPHTVTDGLVFYYDMGNPQKSWKGAPTTNIVSNWNLDTGWSKGYCTDIIFNEIPSPYGITAPTVGFKDVDGNGSGYWYSYGNFASGQTPGSIMTVSMYVKVAGPTCTLRCYTADNSETGRVFGSAITVSESEGWKRCIWTITIPNPSVSESLSFEFSSIPATSRMWLCAPQMETGSFATPFVVGTRSNTQAIIDLTGNNIITANSLTYASDGTFSFDNSNDVIETNFPEQTLNNSTICAWVYDNTADTNYRAIVQNNIASDDALYVNPSNTLMWWPATSSTLVVPKNQWVFVAASHTYGSGILYQVNGNQEFVSGTFADPTDWDFLRIGAHSTSDGERWGGYIPMVQVYNRALSAAEVQQNFNALRGRYGL
jgi:hypothetical protein